MSFCRITGKARGLPKANYFPLLPPISPADAKRCCRITTKSQGLPGHHYIPALLGARPPKAHCKVTAKSEGQGPHHFPDMTGLVKPHETLPGYKYVYPVFDDTKKQQKMLLNMMQSKQSPNESNARYVYAIEEKATGLVIPAELEAAVRDGDVKDVLLDEEGDSMLVKMNKGPSVTIDVVTLVFKEGDILWDGMGPSEKVLKQRKKEEREAELRKKKRQQGLLRTKKIFEEREERDEIEALEDEKRAELRKAKLLKVKLRSGGEQVVDMNGGITPEIMAPEDENGPVFGHIVQTATGVEFFPKSSICDLPNGKVVPGRLIKNEDGVKFIPGIMSDGRFVPGQIVMTNNGEHFIAGQVVDTSEGPKFVPGQVVETSSGPKFLPGQTIDSEDGPTFVPGQIIETKAGPTFIPGQIIFSDDKARFVPGRVVDTAEGPRFVPGRVVETGNQVTFVCGQVVETPEGLKFIAPDLQDDSEGGHEFSVQGFEVTPEELRLLRPTMSHNAANINGDMTIDSKILRQLSEAGMAVGRQVPAELPAVDIRSLPQVLERLKLSGVSAIKMGHILCSLAQVAKKINCDGDSCVSSVDVNEDLGSGLIHAAEKQKDVAKYLKSIVAATVAAIGQDDNATEESIMSAIASAIDRALGEWADNVPMDGVVEYLHTYLTKPENIAHVALETMQFLQESETVLDRLNVAISSSVSTQKAIEKITAILKDNMGDAFQKLSAGNPDLALDVLHRLQENQSAVTEQDATELVQNAIVSAVRAKSGQVLQDILASREAAEGKEFKDLVLQAIGLARALGLYSVSSKLTDVLNYPELHDVLANDPTTMDILERLTVMRQFAELKPDLGVALRQLVSDPETARTDPGVRELVRHSTALMVVPEEFLQSSANIPASLLMPDNALKMEEYLARTRGPRTLLILKRGIQAVVPREASRAVLMGQVPYAVLDEKGIRYFEPMHQFSTMKMPQYAAHCFSMYACPQVEDDYDLNSSYSTPRGSISSYDDYSIRKPAYWSRRSSHCPSTRQPTVRHILDRRLSDWANGNLFINNGTLFQDCDSIGYSTSDDDEQIKKRSGRLDYSIHQVGELYLVTQDFHSDDAISTNVQLGETVEVIDYGDWASKRMRFDVDEGSGLLDNSAARYKLSVRPRRKHADTRQRAMSPFGADQARWKVRTASGVEGWVPTSILKPQDSAGEEQRPEDAKYKREAVVRELVETEEEFGRDMQGVVEHYMRPLDSSSTPRVVRDNIQLIFSNFKQIANFHNTVLIEGVKYYANEPRMLGRTFLRLERDFDKHVAYCRDEPAAQEFLLDNPTARDFFEDLGQLIGDDKSLSEHLKLPIQRIHDYQLLFKELVKYSNRLSENTDDLQRALDLMLAVPHRANDNKFISNIEGYHGNIHKLGRLLRHDWFTVTDSQRKSKERYLFLFKARILICKVKRISEDRSVFVLKEIAKLPELEVRDCEQLTAFELISKDSSDPSYPATLSAHHPEIKTSWLKEIRKYASDALALQEHAADDLRIQVEEIQVRKDPGTQLRAQLEAKLSKQAKKFEVETSHDIVQETINAQRYEHGTNFEADRSESPVLPEPQVLPTVIANPEKSALPSKSPESATQQPTSRVPDQKQDLTITASPKVESVLEEKPTPSVQSKPAPQVEQVPVVKPEEPKPSTPVTVPVKEKVPEAKPEPPKLVSEPVKAPVKESVPTTVPEPKPEESKPSPPVTAPVKETVPESKPEPPKVVSEPVSVPEAAPKPEPVKVASELSSTPAPVESPPPAAVPPPVPKTSEPKSVQEPSLPAKVESKTPAEAPAKVEPISVAKVDPSPPAKVETTTPTKVEKSVPAKVQTPPAKVEESPQAKVESPAAAKVDSTSKVIVEESSKVEQQKNIDQKTVKAEEEDMSRRTSKSISTKVVEESYSMSSETVVQSSSLYASSTTMQQSSSSSYQSSGSTSGAITSSGSHSAAITSGGSHVTITEVTGRPVFKRTLSGLTKRPGDSAYFECQLDSAAQVTWLKDNKALEDKLADRVTKSSTDDNTHRLDIIHLHEYDSGIYTALAKGAEGSSTCTAQLLVQAMTDEERARLAAANAPEFSVKLKDTELLQNTNFRFMVKVNGKPNPEVQFFKDGQPVSSVPDRVTLVDEKAERGFYELVIADVQAQDSGKYSCIAKNKFGEATCEGRVTVTDAKKVFEGLENAELLQPGEKANFSWLRDGKPFDPEERFKVLLGNEEDSLALVFQHVRPEDAGLYTCVASTSTGRISCSAELSVMGTVSQLSKEPAKPSLSIETRQSEVNIGGTAMLEAKILGFPKPDIQWFHEGNEVKPSGRLKFLFEDSESMTLVIKNVTAEDAGVYKIVAKNELGEDATELQLVVKAAPKFKRKFTETNCMQGEVLKLTTEIEGCPTPQVKWYRDGKEVVESERIKTVKEGNLYSLLIGNCELTDTASYSVVATNEVNQSSDFVHVKVHSAPKFLKEMDKKVEVSEGAKVIFNVSVQADPVPTVRWLKNGNEIKSDGAKYTISSENGSLTLVVHDAGRDDSASYTVELSNEYGSKSCSCRADVKCGPKFRTGLKDTVAHEGCSDVELTVNINAYPKPTVKWFFDDIEITEKRNEFSKTEEGESYKLIIKEATIDLQGKYTVKVSNDLGATEDSCKLTVNCKPRFKKPLQEKTQTDEGATLTLEVECYACPEPEIKWFKDGKEVTTDAHIKITRDSHRSETYSMTLNLVKASDDGEYEVKATNTMGTVSSKTHVHVFTKTTEERTDIEEEEEKVEEKVEEKEAPTVEGTEDSHTIEQTKRTSVQFTETHSPGGVAFEEVGSYVLQEKSTCFSFSSGIVEEFSEDGEGFSRSNRLSVSRGVSIVSVSEDERTLSPSNSTNDVTKLDVEGNIVIKRESSLKECDFEDELYINEKESKARDSPLTAIPKPDISTKVIDANDETDAEMESLLERVRRQRSLLEEIIQKENNTDGAKTFELDDVPGEGTAVDNAYPLDSSDSVAQTGEGNLLRINSKDGAILTNNISPTETPLSSDNIEASFAEDGGANTSVDKDNEVNANLEEDKTPLDKGNKAAKSSDKDNEVNAILEEEKTPFDKGNKAAKSSDKDNEVNAISEEDKTPFDKGNKAAKFSDKDKKTLESFEEKDKVETPLNTVENDEARQSIKPEVAAQNESELGPVESQRNNSAPLDNQIKITLDKPLENGNLQENNENLPSNAETSLLQVFDALKCKSIDSKGEETHITSSVPALSQPELPSQRIVKEPVTKENFPDDTKDTIELPTPIESSLTEAFPKITNHDLVERNVFESLSTNYFVEATGIPRPEAAWFRDGVPLTASNRIKITDEGTTYKLEINDLVVADGGTIKCKISNRLGEVVQEAKLNLTEVNAFRKPIFKLPLVDLKIPKLDPAVLTCIVVGDPVPDITWLHDGVEVPQSSNKSKPGYKRRTSRSSSTQSEVVCDETLAIANTDLRKIENDLVECTYTLTLPRTVHKDTGTYTIVAKNKYGQSESSARLDVLLKPEIYNLKDMVGIPYEQAEFSATVHSNPPCTIAWLDKLGAMVKTTDARVLSEDRANEVFKLSFTNIGLGDAGYYTLVAKNAVGDTQQQVHFNVHSELPSVVKRLEDKRANDYSDVDFHIRFNGIPKPQVKWLKDGEQVITTERVTIETADEGQVSSSLNIKHFCANDVGQYSAVASNIVGSVESSALLRMIQMPPTFGKMLPRLEEVAETEPLELKCKLDGSPVPTVSWFKDGEPLQADHHVHLTANPDGTVRLFIENVKPTDCGAYKLVAENPNGTTAAICAVAVKPKPSRPVFLKPLENKTEMVGEPLRLEAQIMAYPAPEVKWFKDGQPLRASQVVNFINQPGGIIGLLIEALRPEDAGQYTVRITNRLGDANGEAKVDVQQRDKRPAFDAHLMPVSVVEGFPAKLEVKVAGHPKPTIKWSHRGKEVVPDGEHIKVIEHPDGSVALIIDKATPLDAGEWAVTASNDKGDVSSKAELSVTERGIAGEPECRPSFIHALRALSVEEGTPLLISAPFVGNPIPDVTWTKDGVPLKPNDRTLFTCDGKKVGLEIKPAFVGDTGTYACRLVSPLGESTSEAEAVVRKVFQAPTFTQKFTDLQQLPTYVAKFPARVIGVPRPEIEWFFGDRPVRESEKYHLKRDGDACCLYIRDCETSDSGRYRCVAKNKEGTTECEASLDVVKEIERQQKAEAPAFLKKLGDCEVFKGMTARFTACATGVPEPDFEWYRGETKLYPNDRIRMDRELNGLLRLSIAGVDVGDVGRYRLQISNSHGNASCEADLRFDDLEARPRKPLSEQYVDYEKFRSSGVPLPLADRPIISRMTDRHLTLSWKPSIPHGPRAPVTYRVEMAEQPDGDWFTARSGVRSCACDIRNLEPFRDYKFRIRVENKYGVSDPSPFAVTYRQKLEPDPPKFVPFLTPGIDFRPETSPYFPKDFDIEKPPHDGYSQAPRFLRQEHDTQYGIKNHNSNLFWFVYGYPKPKMTYLFNDEPIEMGGRYDCSYTRNGQATLFINKMLDRDVGIYEAIASNEHGEARQRVRMDIAEYPVFIERPEETVVMLRKSGKITARVIGVPYPDIKWYKDWQPLAPSSRIKMQLLAPDQVQLTISDAINKDEGLYSISASNVAGAVSSSAMVHIEENENEYNYMTYGKGRNVKPRTKPFADFYDLGDELGRGTQGVTYHAVERLSGRNYAAKVMHGRSELRAFMLNELEMMNALSHRKLIRLQDSYETRDQLVLVMELAGGGELLETLTSQTFTTETEIAGYIRQLLWGLEYLHSQDIAHLGLTIGDLLLSHPGGDDLKICDFGLARRIAYGKLGSLDYGMPEFVSPEIANGEGVTYSADLWSVGIITYILLSGYSPFKGLNDRETLTRVREGKWEFREDRFCNISAEARDFISQLLVYQAAGRMDVRAALKHPWLTVADRIPVDQFSITTDTLTSYYSSLKDWYNNASSRLWYRRRPLSGAFTHPSRMVYPPGHEYTPPPEEVVSKEPRDPRTWEQTVPSRDPLDYEVGEFKSESHYQYGPDTYLLQLRDVDLPCRLRRYMQVAANRNGAIIDISDKHIDLRTPIIRERRRFGDVMDEEIDDERRARINKYGSSEVYSLRRLRHELGARSEGHAEAEAMLETRRDGHVPFFREKPQMLAVIDDQPAELSCLAVGDPAPNVQWFKNDLVVVESSRVRTLVDDDGRAILQFLPALHVDVGIYKAVARNKVGQTVARTRVVVASTPSSPDSPEAAETSDSEILLRWKQPKDDGHSPVLNYSLQYKEADNVEWLNVANNIDHEFWVVRNLKPLTNYVFRLSARNVIGWSDKGIPTALIKTKELGSPKIVVSGAMRHLQSHTESSSELPSQERQVRLNYSVENKPIQISSDSNVAEKYSFVSELTRGEFSVIVKGVDKGSDEYVVAKLLEATPETEKDVLREVEVLCALRHERVVTLLAALRPSTSVAVLVMEKLQGADILTYFTSRHEYTEDMVATVITQVLDGLQYLQWRGLCHLNLQPDNIVLSSVRSLQVKIVDFGAAQIVSKLGTHVTAPHNDYSAPEVLAGEAAYPQSDIWSLGTLTYVLLSGVSPFRGLTPDETRQNIIFVRYRFEHLYKELTQEATRFIMLLFKRTPTKRPTVEECYEHRWLLPTDFMIKKRERAVFLGNRLKEYSDLYHKEKLGNAIKTESLISSFSSRGPLARSNSIQEELTTTF